MFPSTKLKPKAGRAHDFKALSKQKPYEGVKMTLQARSFHDSVSGVFHFFEENDDLRI